MFTAVRALTLEMVFQIVSSQIADAIVLVTGLLQNDWPPVSLEPDLVFIVKHQIHLKYDKYVPLICSFATSRLIYIAFKADLKARKQCHLLRQYYLCRNLCDRLQGYPTILIQCLTQWLTRTWYWMLRIHEPVSTILITFVKQWRFPHGKPYQDGLSKPFLTTSCIWCTWGLQKTTYLHAWRFWSFGVTTMRKAKVMSNSSKGPALEMKDDCKRKKFPVFIWKNPELDSQNKTW